MLLGVADEGTLFDLWRKFTMEIGTISNASNNSKRLQKSGNFAFYTKEHHDGEV
jgi:hypothetical protein